jgi:hypothetical protein
MIEFVRVEACLFMRVLAILNKFSIAGHCDLLTKVRMVPNVDVGGDMSIRCVAVLNEFSISRKPGRRLAF